MENRKKSPRVGRIYQIPQKRWVCAHCGTSGWETGREKVRPLYDHDRPNGARCPMSK